MNAAFVLFASLLVSGSSSEFAFCGVNEAGMEFGHDKLPGTPNTDYALISDDGLKTPASYGMNIIRLPFLWERLQPSLNGPLDSTHLGFISQTVQDANKRGMYVLLDVHNYARYRGNVIGSTAVPFSAFYDLWNKIAASFKNNNMVIFGLMNEPHDMDYNAVLTFMNEGIKGIRAAGATQLIFVAGNDWTGVHSWMGGNNHKYMINITDPLNNFMYEMHQYFDTDSSGQNNCDPNWSLSAKFDGTTTWLRQNKKTAFLGEFGINDSPQCIAILKQTLAYLKQNSDVWRGFAYWSAGPWWGDYFYSVEAPRGTNQMAALKEVIPSVYEVINTPSPTPTPAPTPIPTPTPTPTPSTISGFAFCGVNEAGMEFGHDKLPGTANTDYATISDDGLKTPASYGMNIIRLPFLWERIQPTLNQSLDAAYLGLITKTVQDASARKMYVLLDVHNYGRYRGDTIGSPSVPYAAFYDLWNKIATQFKNNNLVLFGLMNEPHDMDYNAVVQFQNIAIKGIRDAGATQLIFVAGNDWTGAHSWMSNNYKYMLDITDPLGFYTYEMHQYFDSDSSGTQSCDPNWSVSAKLDAVTTWLRQNKKTAFLGEFGINDSPECIAIFKGALAYLKTNSDVWRGFAYWSAGPWWGDYPYSVESPRGTNQMMAMKDVIPSVYSTFTLASPSSTTESLIGKPGAVSGVESLAPTLAAIIVAVLATLA